MHFVELGVAVVRVRIALRTSSGISMRYERSRLGTESEGPLLAYVRVRTGCLVDRRHFGEAWLVVGIPIFLFARPYRDSSGIRACRYGSP